MKKKRPKNKYRSFEQMYLENPIYEPLPLYHSEDGKPTTDVSIAVCTPLGVPIQIGYSEELVAKPLLTLRLSYNPNNPSARQLALEARANMNNHVDSTIYMDKFDASAYANNSIKAFEQKYNTIKSTIAHEKE